MGFQDDMQWVYEHRGVEELPGGATGSQAGIWEWARRSPASFYGMYVRMFVVGGELESGGNTLLDDILGEEEGEEGEEGDV